MSQIARFDEISRPKNRAERRQQARKDKQYDQRQTFTKREVEAMNTAAYEYGMVFVLQAAARIAGIGEKRIHQLKDEIIAVELENGVTRDATPKWYHASAEQLKKGVIE